MDAPDSGSSGEEIVAYRVPTIAAGCWPAALVFALGLAVLMVFAAGLHRIIRRAETDDGWLAMGSATSASARPGSSEPGPRCSSSSRTGRIQIQRWSAGFWDAGWLAYNIAGFGFVAWMTIIIVATLRHDALPRWSAWVGIPVAAINLVGPFAVQAGTGAFSPQGWYALVVGLTFAVWLLVQSQSLRDDRLGWHPTVGRCHDDHQPPVAASAR